VTTIVCLAASIADFGVVTALDCLFKNKVNFEVNKGKYSYK